MRKVFNSPSLQKEFDKNGFVQVPFIAPEKVERLKNLFFETLPQSGGSILPEEVKTAKVDSISYDFTFIDKNPDFKRLIFRLISEEFSKEVNGYLDNYSPLIANYIRKMPNAGEVPLHQNWAFVDEYKYTSVSIWCPLVDSTRENGTMEVVPGSHKRFAPYRGPMVPWELDKLKDKIIKDYMLPIDTKAGNAVILDDSIIHYTRPNCTSNLRLAIQLILKPTEVPSLHYNRTNDAPDTIKVLSVEQDFYMTFNPWKIPENEKVVDVIPFTEKYLSESEFAAALKRPKFNESQGVLQRLKSIFS